MKNLFYLVTILMSLTLSSCTLSMNMANTEGTASDVIDDTQSNTPTVSPSVNVKE